MERIASFCVDHTKLDRGMYLSRQDGDVLTWDIRMKRPNHGDYLSTGAAHTLEHLFATYARNSACARGQRSGVRQLPRYGSARRQGRSRCHAAGAGSTDRRRAALLSYLHPSNSSS